MYDWGSKQQASDDEERLTAVLRRILTARNVDRDHVETWLRQAFPALSIDTDVSNRLLEIRAEAEAAEAEGASQDSISEHFGDLVDREESLAQLMQALQHLSEQSEEVRKALEEVRSEIKAFCLRTEASIEAQGDSTRHHQDRVADQLGKQIASTPDAVVEAWKRSTLAPMLVVPCLLGAWKDPEERHDGPLAKLFPPPHQDRLVVDLLHDDDPKKFNSAMQDAVQLADAPVRIQNGTWTVPDRYALWQAIGSQIFDGHLDRFETLAEEVLGEFDPRFELPEDKRWAANIYGKALPFSHVLRDGMIQTLALLGSHPDVLVRCKRGKPGAIASGLIHKMLSEADWKRWGSLDRLLPTLAEASPESFLNVVETTLDQNPALFDQLFAQEGVGINGGNYLTGLWWALEKLAWHPDHLVRVASLLGRLDRRDPGGNYANRPGESLKNILTPWKPQTLASTEKQLVAVRAVLTDEIESGWKLLLALLPSGRDISTPNPRPTYRSWDFAGRRRPGTASRCYRSV